MVQACLTGTRRSLLLPLMLILTLTGPLHAGIVQDSNRSDLIRIQIKEPPDNHQMPEVTFPHDRHTEALPTPSCEKCHLKKKADFQFKFKRLEDLGYFNEKELYHGQCIGCHDEFYSQEKKSGPRTGQCRQCHAKTPPYVNIAQPFGMDRSLHYRHIIAESIVPEKGFDRKADGNCSACHHEYDKALKKTVYAKGKEGTCRYCHKSQNTQEARSFKTAAHQDCLNCHIQMAATGIKAGPFYCSPCHDPAQQKGIAKLEDIPRINRNQPDAALMSLWVKDAAATGKPSLLFVRPVAFNHLAHEKKVSLCRTCHHESMESCVSCHTRTGDTKGKFVTLDHAMHASASSVSCIGCHRNQTVSKDCAGCHAQKNKGRVDDKTCASCHSISRQSLDPLPANKEMTAEIAKSKVIHHQKPTRIPDDQIPDKVLISIMADQYEGVTMPHRQIVSALFKRTENSGLASFFHNEPTSLCRGCHHYSPSAEAFPKCASCHELSSKDDGGTKPGLMGAYHGQCIACHQQMGIEKPAATDCSACHKKKGEKGFVKLNTLQEFE